MIWDGETVEVRRKASGDWMKPHRIVGLVAAMACMVAGVVLGSPLILFFDLTSLILVCIASGAMMAATHGRDAGRLWSAILGWLLGADSDPSHPQAHREVASMALDFGQYLLLAGAMGTIIGQVQMLQNLSDPSTIGPALAVSLLTLFYGGMSHILIAVPVSQHHLRMAGTDASEFSHQSAGLRLIAVLGICTGISFFIMLLAMSNGFS